MKAYKVSEARARFGDLLDEAQGGETVIIERHGVRFRLEPELAAARPVRAHARMAYVHPDVLGGAWTWASGTHGLSFRRRRSRA